MRFSLNKHEVEAVFAAKSLRNTSCFTLRWRHGNESFDRVAFAFSAKSGSAVLRNRFKRRLRHLVTSQNADCLQNLHLVILPRKQFKQISDSDWAQDRERILKIIHELKLVK